ncbi:hypothetical protein GMST_07400 [Geomonas silvestris]|uniref:T6SS Phospholipase effector Tle1-like catalytic domain-containing protein n=1 Tax=Geomonas silvestris TaxID=2740184 RepID=A0A6V8MEJ2_9BACT|nr:DUF2235 domain-containing protein [Geomonas silvestris]GFO58415.1 hypothetical protein GMST_07400 [Geomonas silvestris]
MTGTAAKIKHTGSSNEAGSPCYRCQEQKSAAGRAPVRIRIAVFFDGTLNNRTNTGLGEKGINRGVSYENALTNVAILELYYQQNPEYDHSLSIYIEGIGTEDDEADSSITAGTGWGSTGILDKVETGMTKVIGEISKHLKRDQEIECLHLDCFGFSRGAAAARNFIYSVLFGQQNTLKLRLQSSTHYVGEIKVKFVGLYDTVASYGLNHRNDTEELHLDAIRYAENVVQLAAAEEHRKHFPLTNINSAPHGVQLFLPGAHSDIGGGYPDNMDEVDHQIMFVCRRHGLKAADKAALAREREWLLASGWYYEDEIQKVDQWDEVKVTRKGISNHFHRIPLKMMAELATENGVHFSAGLMSDFSIHHHLKEIEAFIRESPLDSPEYWLALNTDMIKKFRHDHLHFSACFGSTLGCNQPQFTDDDIVHGHRKREIIYG